MPRPPRLGVWAGYPGMWPAHGRSFHNVGSSGLRPRLERPMAHSRSIIIWRSLVSTKGIQVILERVDTYISCITTRLKQSRLRKLIRIIQKTRKHETWGKVPKRIQTQARTKMCALWKPVQGLSGRETSETNLPVIRSMLFI